MSGSMTAVPVALNTNLFAIVDHLDQNPLQQHAHDGLAIRLGGGLRRPEPW
ncbi:hypothetical protein [Rhodovibrio sodomensis]|uniref:hypothetical protein n=1 Tax=Rhodovibrio sodomensis TaxID=1088 RepID=UPI0019054DD3|nr:hypothetical protein [Rhodovibrio sodomensis]